MEVRRGARCEASRGIAALQGEGRRRRRCGFRWGSVVVVMEVMLLLLLLLLLEEEEEDR
jgi:hypothetical protein